MCLTTDPSLCFKCPVARLALISLSPFFTSVDGLPQDYDGNVVDAAMLALTTALRELQLPETHINDDGTVFIVAADQHSSAPGRLVIKHTPVACTFGVLDERLLVDPTAAEEQLLDGGGGALTTVVVTDTQELCGIYKPGGGELSDEGLAHCLRLAKGRAAEVTAIVLEARAAKGGEGTGMEDES